MPPPAIEMLLEVGVHPSEILNVVRFHHERLDGSGYPYALKGDQINQDVRIIMICDIYAALRENRPYNRPMDRVAALKRSIAGSIWTCSRYLHSLRFRLKQNMSASSQ